jgi:type III restriction enzyme
MDDLKIQYDSNQAHQVDGIESSVNLFTDFTKRATQSLLGDDTVPNMDQYEMLDESWLYDNLIEAQRKNDLVGNMKLCVDEGFEIIGSDAWRYPYYTCDMETGTGKTYVYLRTIHELRKKYGWGKFIIIVPSVAIFEGVAASFASTKEHFASLYSNETIFLTKYSGQNISKLRSFANSRDVAIMVMTIDSFNKAANVIYKPTEKLQGEKLPYQYIQETRPILILDESQNYTSVKSREALRTLHPLFALKYSATPTEKGATPEENRELMNRYYHLSPVDAFKQNLVKKVEVLGVTEENNLNDSSLSWRIVREKSRARIAAETNVNIIKDGVSKREKVLFHDGDDLHAKTHNDIYKGIVIGEINIGDGFVRYTNGDVVRTSEAGEVTFSKEEVFRVQIDETIKAHMIKQEQMEKRGVKVLSLFFIDKVANYVADDALVKRLFDESFDRQKKSYPYFTKRIAEKVREGYFAKKVRRNAPDEYVDTSIDKKNKVEKELEKAAYNLIMKSKEKLLQFGEPVSFIFAHSALKEGWDNPNVFQICTLNTAVSDRRKRQEIGRGLRLAVDQGGNRVFDEDVNILTVVANESYEDYCERLQSDYRESGDIPPPAPSKATKADAKRNGSIFKSSQFLNFWQNLCRKTEYTIHVDSDEVIINSINKINAASFPEPNIVVVKGKFVMTEFEITLTKIMAKEIWLEIKISDTLGNENTRKRRFKKGDDLAKISKDDRFKGFKIVDIVEDNDHSEIHFADRGKLRLNESVKFTSERGQKGDPHHREEAQTSYPIFNFIQRAEEATHLKKNTLVQIFKGLKEEVKEKIFKNPEGFSAIFISSIKEILADHIAKNVQYSLTDELYDYDIELIFPESRKFPQKELVDGGINSLYDQVQIDSDIERAFVEYKLNTDDRVVCYFKFPNQFKIMLPKIIGNYNPDWGIIRLNEERKLTLELVRETKGNVNPNLLQFPNEKRKIDCATKHFAQTKVNYKHIKGDENKWW